MSTEYGKTENLFTRNPDTHKLNIGEFRLAEFELIKTWHVTEKIDGTNMRVVYDPKAKTVEIRGRSDNAQVHPDLLRNMAEMFPLENLQAQFDEYLGDQIELGTTVTIYGEGYGAGIQKGGGRYSQKKTFRIFDVLYHRYTGLNSWCQPSTTEMIARGLDVSMVPIISRQCQDLAHLINIVRYLPSRVSSEENGREVMVAEGVVCRTDPYLYNEFGSRIMFKLKHEDLP